MQSTEQKKQAYAEFFQDEELEILLAIVDSEKEFDGLHDALKDKTIKHGELIVYGNDGNPEIWAARGDLEDIPCKTIFLLTASDKTLIAALQEKYGSIVTLINFC